MPWNGLWADILLAFRQARQRPSHALTALAVLAFGIGLNTAVFSLLYFAILKPLPYPDPSRLVAVHNRFPQSHLPRQGASPLDYLDLREHHELFSDAGAFYYLDLSRTAIEHPEKVNAVAITESLFQTLGVKPLIGRTFTAEEELHGGPHAVLVSEAYWQGAFGRDPEILHRTLRLNGDQYPVIGVMPGSFQFPNVVTQMWVPLIQPLLTTPGARLNKFLHMYARLAPGVDFERAAARIEQLSRQMSAQYPRAYPLDQGWRFFLLPMAKDDDGVQRSWLVIFFAGVTGLLVIACSNVAGLFLVRSTERQADVSLRMALGATWLAVLGIISVTCLLACAFPAWRASRLNPMESLRAE